MASALPLLAKRFLVSKDSDRFLSMITWVSVLGVALGVLALTVVTSVINGFENELTRAITGLNGDVIFYSRGEPVRKPEEIEAKVRELVPDLVAITPSFVTQMMVAGPNATSGAILEGVDLATFGDVTRVHERVISGVLPKNDGEVVLGAAIAEKIGVKAGQTVRLIAPFLGGGDPSASDEASLGTPKAVDMRVSGIVRMGLHEYDSQYVFAALPTVQKFLELGSAVSGFRLKLRDGADARRAAERLNENIGAPFRAREWGSLNRNIFFAIQLEKVVIAIILTVIVIVAAFNVVSTLMMMIHDKTKEIAILKAMGLRAGQSFRLFSMIGMGIGLTGTVIGIGLGLIINQVLARTKLINLPADIYYINYLPAIVRWSEVGIIFVFALLITFAATLYPAVRVSTRSPLDGIRYDS